MLGVWVLIFHIAADVLQRDDMRREGAALSMHNYVVLLIIITWLKSRLRQKLVKSMIYKQVVLPHQSSSGLLGRLPS